MGPPCIQEVAGWGILAFVRQMHLCEAKSSFQVGGCVTTNEAAAVLSVNYR